MELFFINVLPPSDRWSDKNYKSILEDYIVETVESPFYYTLVAVGDKRHDPWVVAQYAMQRHSRFSPLIAVNPYYQHLIHAAKKLISLQNLYINNIALNLVSGSYFNEMNAAGQTADFDKRNLQLTEFLNIQQELLGKNGRSDFKGSFYNRQGATVLPRSNREKTDFFISGAFAPHMKGGDNSVFFMKNLRPLSLEQNIISGQSGLCVGLCVRPTQEEAEQELKRLFPVDRKGRMLFELSMNNFETPWNRWLSEYLKTHDENDPNFCLSPLTSFSSSAPFFVGSYEQAAKNIQKRIDLGYRFFLLDFHPKDFVHVRHCLDLLLDKNSIKRA